jgi:uncharacterized protein (TIGR03437 family)
VLTSTSPLPSGVAGGGNYNYTFVAQGGTQPYTWTLVGTPPPGLQLTPNGLLNGFPSAAGTFLFSVKLTDAQQASITRQFQVTFTPAPSLLQVSSTQLNFTAFQGGDSPAPQTLAVVSSSVTPVNFAVQIDSGTAGSTAPMWLAVQSSRGTSPGAIVVMVDSSALVVGIADARLRITIPGDATRLPVDVAVHVDITASVSKLDITPNLARLRARAAGPTTLKQTFLIRNAGGGGGINFTTAVVRDSSWIANVSPGAGQTSLNRATPVTITLNTQGLTPGVYTDSIRFAAPGNSVDVPISLFIAPAGPFLQVDTRGLRFQARQGAGSTFTQTVRVLNAGDPASTVNWTADLLTGGDWLAFGGTRGTATASQPGLISLTPNQNAASLSTGPHYALIRITDQSSLGSPQYVVAVLDVAPASSAALPELGTGFLYFAAPQNSTSQVGGAVRVFTSSVSFANFQAAANTNDGGAWLQVNPTSSSAGTATPGIVSLAVNPSGLAAGVYKGQVNIAMGGALRSKDVTLVVKPQAGLLPPDSACVPTRLSITLGNLDANFSVPAQYPALISAQVFDNCNTPVTNASVTATFSNGDPPLTLVGDGVSNTYFETWQPGTASASMGVTVRANLDPYPEVSQTFTGAVQASAAPVLNRGGTVNNLNPRLDDPVAPGTVAALFGSHLAPQAISPGFLPLPTSVQGTFVLVGGLQLPLFYVSDGQINAQLPVEMPVNTPQSVIVGSGGGYTLPDQILVTKVDPGVATVNGALIAQHADFAGTLVDNGHPARPGETLVMYLVGMGATNPGTATGLQASGPLAPAVVQPTVTIDGQMAAVPFAGLTPGGIGLYQINFLVPPTARPGALAVVVAQGEAVANAATLVVGN